MSKSFRVYVTICVSVLYLFMWYIIMHPFISIYDNVPHGFKMHLKIAHSLFYSDHEID